MRIGLAVAAIALWANAAVAQIGLPWPGPGNTHSAGSSFVGIGDVQSGWALYYGVIPYSGSYAASLGNVFDFTCTGPGSGTVPFLSTGALNLSGAISGCSGTITVTNVYNQTGTTLCSTGLSAACDIYVPITGSIVFLQSGCPTTSVVTYCFSASAVITNGDYFATQAQPFLISTVFDRPTSARGSLGTILRGITQVGAASTNDKYFAYDGGSLVEFTATDGTTHAAQMVFDDASSTYLIDGGTVTTMSSSPGALAFEGTLSIGAASNNFTGFIYEIAMYPGSLSSGIQASIASNQSTNVGLGF